jgi:hypothetical protein
VVPLSQRKNGGSITERHILFAMAKALVEQIGKGSLLAGLLERKLNTKISEAIVKRLDDADNPYYEYDLLGVLKSSLNELIYIQPDDEDGGDGVDHGKCHACGRDAVHRAVWGGQGGHECVAGKRRNGEYLPIRVHGQNRF